MALRALALLSLLSTALTFCPLGTVPRRERRVAAPRLALGGEAAERNAAELTAAELPGAAEPSRSSAAAEFEGSVVPTGASAAAPTRGAISDAEYQRELEATLREAREDAARGGELVCGGLRLEQIE